MSFRPADLILPCSAASPVLFAVSPDDSCGGMSMHWWILEPLAKGARVHNLFTAAGSLGFTVGLLPLGLLVLAAVNLFWGWRQLRRSRENNGNPLVSLVQMALGAIVLIQACWTGLLWSLVA